MNKNLEATLAESFEKTFKNLQKEGLFENISSFDLSLKGNKLNIKLNENTITAPTIEELDQLETQFYKLVSACEKEDDEYRSKFSNIYLVYLDSSSSEHDGWEDDEGNEYTKYDIDWDDDDNEVINGIPLDQFKESGGTAVINFPMYSLDEPEKALNGNGRLVGVMCEYLAEEADPKSLFMSKLRTNNFIKKFCNKYHLTPMFYIGSRDRGDKNWENKGADICSDIWETVWDPSIDGHYDTCEISGPFGVEYDSSSDF